MISDEKKDEALTYLAETDEEAARAKALVKALEDMKKPVLANCFLKAEGAQGLRLKQAECHEDYLSHLTSLSNARYQHETMYEKRQTSRIIIDTWRSENANRRQGPNV